MVKFNLSQLNQIIICVTSQRVTTWEMIACWRYTFGATVRRKSISSKEKQIWVIREKRIKAKGNNRKRPSLIQRISENWKKKRRINKGPLLSGDDLSLINAPPVQLNLQPWNPAEPVVCTLKSYEPVPGIFPAPIFYGQTGLPEVDDAKERLLGWEGYFFICLCPQGFSMI